MGLLDSIPPPTRPPRHRRGAWFLKGPVPLSWLIAAARLRGKALHLGVRIWFQAGLTNRREVELSAAGLRSMGVGEKAARNGLRALESAELVTVERHPGRAPRVTLLDGPRE